MDEVIKIKKPLWKKWWFWVILIFVVLPVVFIGIVGSIGSSLPKDTTQPTQTVTEAPTATEQPLQYTFDVPSLMGKTIDEIKIVLQPYMTKSLEPTDAQIKAGVKDWDVGFTKDGKELLVNYDIASKKVNNFFISTDDKSGKTKDKSHLLELGNLKENDSRYTIEFVKVFIDPNSFTGVKITPQ